MCGLRGGRGWGGGIGATVWQWEWLKGWDVDVDELGPTLVDSSPHITTASIPCQVGQA